jgi:hypothetical protein
MIDTVLVGNWSNSTRAIRIETNGDVFELSQHPVGLSFDGSSLQIGTTQLSRSLGDSAQFFGAWFRQTNVGPDLHVQDLYWKPDGTVINRWLINDILQEINIGIYTVVGGTLDAKLLFGRARTQPYGTIRIDRGFTPQEIGVYNLMTEITLVMDIDGIQTQYTKT